MPVLEEGALACTVWLRAPIAKVLTRIETKCLTIEQDCNRLYVVETRGGGCNRLRRLKPIEHFAAGPKPLAVFPDAPTDRGILMERIILLPSLPVPEIRTATKPRHEDGWTTIASECLRVWSLRGPQIFCGGIECRCEDLALKVREHPRYVSACNPARQDQCE